MNDPAYPVWQDQASSIHLLFFWMVSDIMYTTSTKIICDDELKSFIKRTINELEILYEALKKDKLNPVVDDRVEHFKKNVIEEFKKEKKRFKFVNQK